MVQSLSGVRGVSGARPRAQSGSDAGVAALVAPLCHVLSCFALSAPVSGFVELLLLGFLRSRCYLSHCYQGCLYALGFMGGSETWAAWVMDTVA